MPKTTPGPRDKGYVKDPKTPYKYIPAPLPPVSSSRPGFRYSYIDGKWHPIPDVINKATKPRINQLTLNAAAIGDPEPYIFGRCIADPLLIAADDSGDYVYTDLLWGVGEIDAIEYLVIDNASIGLGDSKTQHFTGTAGQVASTIMDALKGGYDALPNKAHTVTPLTSSAGLDKRAMIRGLKLYDPRTATTVYSTNPALALARMLTDAGYTMDYPSVIIAADYCDELIGVTSPQVKRWEIGGQINLRRDISDWVHVMAQYANCFVDVQGGLAYLVPDAPRASNHAVTADDMIEGSIRVSHSGGRDVPDAVTVTGLTADGEIITYTYGTSGGAGTETKLNLPFYQSGHAIGRKAEETYRKARNNLTLEFTRFDDGIQRTIGDVGTITNAQYGLSAKLMTLTDQKQVGGGRWQCKYYEYSASNYSDVIYEVATNFYILFNPFSPPAGPTPTAVEELVTSGGVTSARFKITFTGIQWAYLQEYTVKAYALSDGKIVLNTDVAPLGVVTHTTYTTGPLVSGTTYRIEVRVRSITNTVGLPGTVDATSSLAPNALLSYGNLTNMHVYTLDGDGLYCTTSEKSGSPQAGQTWADRFSDSPLGAWAAGETWLGNQIIDTVFETEVWDSGTLWGGGWKFTDLDISELASATRANYVVLATTDSPPGWVDHSGVLYSGIAQYMKAKCTVLDSPGTAGHGLHVKLPVPVDFTLGT